MVADEAAIKRIQRMGYSLSRILRLFTRRNHPQFNDFVASAPNHLQPDWGRAGAGLE
jgi:hypothetical protein